MPNLGINATWGQQQWAQFVLDHLRVESVLLRAGARFLPIGGRVAHVPRTLTDGVASWVPEGTEIPSSAPTGDELVLTPRKLANVVSLSRESIADAPVSELDAVGVALTRSVATSLDVKAFSTDAATADAPGGLRSVATALPAAVAPIDLDGILRSIGTVGEVGAVATAALVSPADLTALRLEESTTGEKLLQPDIQAAGAERIGGAALLATPALPTGTAIIGDMAQVIVGVRSDVEVLFSSEAQFTRDSVVARVTARLDVGVNDARGLLVLKTI
jgi:HK97 family phage major capsid protein